MTDSTKPASPNDAAPAAQSGAGWVQPLRPSSAVFLVALLLLLCLTPLLDGVPSGDVIEGLLLTLVLVTAVPAVGGSRRTVLIAAALACPAVLGKWLNHLRPDLISPLLYLITAGVFAAFVVVEHLRFILGSAKVDWQVLSAAMATYLMLGLLWTFAYLLLAHLDQGAFTVRMASRVPDQLDGFAALYFSLTALSGGTCAEIAPACNLARMLALLEAIVGLFYIAILISRLVALHTARLAAH